jgi:hypothetical protein
MGGEATADSDATRVDPLTVIPTTIGAFTLSAHCSGLLTAARLPKNFVSTRSPASC